MSRFFVGNLFLLLAVISGTAGHVLLKSVVDDVKGGGISWQTVRALFAAERLWRGGGGAMLVVVSFVLWLISLTRLDLSYAYPVACSSLLLVTLFSVIFLGEPAGPRVWIATVLILAGVVLLAPAK
jgi:multidrug transporter EmrE-like cation transporter